MECARPHQNLYLNSTTLGMVRCYILNEKFEKCTSLLSSNTDTTTYQKQATNPINTKQEPLVRTARVAKVTERQRQARKPLGLPESRLTHLSQHFRISSTSTLESRSLSDFMPEVVTAEMMVEVAMAVNVAIFFNGKIADKLKCYPTPTHLFN